MGLFNRKGKAPSGRFKNVENGFTYILTLQDDHLEINIPFGKEAQAKTLRYEQITDIAYTTDFQKIVVSKSPIGRAIAGGLLFGGAGAIVGAVSGMSKKEKTDVKFITVIAYTSKEGEDAFLQYEDSTLTGNLSFVNKLRERCDLNDQNVSNEL